MTGPLDGIAVVEFASIGPGPFCAMVLADLGADVVRIERPSTAVPGSDPPPDPLLRGRRASIAVDLKADEGRDLALRLVERTDVLIEGFRPGVMERLGLGPAECRSRNSRLVYGRVVGWGRDTSRATDAGHDIGFLAATGALHAMGSADRPPPPPLNLIADFGGGGMLLAMGICAALVGRGVDGPGDVVDASMVDGVGLLTSMFHGMRATGAWSDERQANLLDGAAPFYRTYETSDGRHVAVGAIEPAFYAAMLDGLGLTDEPLPAQFDVARWPELIDRFASEFRRRSRDEWAARFEGTDACVVPVRDFGEASSSEEMRFIELGGVVQPAPAPRFASGVDDTPSAPRAPGGDADSVLGELGCLPEEIARLRAAGIVA